MAHIKMYINGTPGGTDGEEITEINSQVLAKTSLAYANAAYDSWGMSFKRISFRCDPGFTATDVQLRFTNNYTGYDSRTNATTSESVLNTNRNITIQTANYNNVFSRTFSIGNLGNVNKTIIIASVASGYPAEGVAGELFTISGVEQED